MDERRRGNRNSITHRAYSLNRTRLGVGRPLDGRSREARYIRDTVQAVAADRGYASFAALPVLLQDVILGAVFIAYQCRILESIPPEKRTARQTKDYQTWYALTLKASQIIGTDRVARDVTDLEKVRRQLESEGEE